MTRQDRVKVKKRAVVTGKRGVKVDGRHNPRRLLSERTSPLSVRLSKKSKEILHNYAASNGIQLATYLRLLLVRHMRNVNKNDIEIGAKGFKKCKNIIESPATSVSISMNSDELEAIANHCKKEFEMQTATYARIIFLKNIENNGKLNTTEDEA